MRPARAIPYTLHAGRVRASAARSRSTSGSSGAAAGVFQVRRASSADDPRTYTVEPGKHVDGRVVPIGPPLRPVGPRTQRLLPRVQGRRRRQRANLDIEAFYDGHGMEISLDIRNRSSRQTSACATGTAGRSPISRSNPASPRRRRGRCRARGAGTTWPSPSWRRRLRVPLLRPHRERRGQHQRPDTLGGLV